MDSPQTTSSALISVATVFGFTKSRRAAKVEKIMTGSSFGGGGSGGTFGDGGGGGGGCSSSSSSSAFSSSGTGGAFNWSHHHHHHNEHRYPSNIQGYITTYHSQVVPLISPRPRQRQFKRSTYCWGVAGFIAVVLGSLWMIFGFYGSQYLEMGLNYSRLLKANKFFVQGISVESNVQNGEFSQMLNDEEITVPTLYSFHRTPSLGDQKESTRELSLDIPPLNHKEWAFWLNKGSELRLEYKVMSPTNLFIVIAQGKGNYENWIEDPGNPKPCLVWKAIQGDGKIEFKTKDSGDDYYVGIGNLHKTSINMTLKMQIKARVYKIDKADFSCPLGTITCTVALSIMESDVGLLMTPEKPQHGVDVWRVTVSYDTRWVTYIVIYALVVLIILSIVACERFLKNLSKRHPEIGPIVSTNISTYQEEYPLINESRHEGKAYGNTHANDFQRVDIPEENLCTICFEEPKNTFFQPCGHCATCYNCSLRIQETSKECPICRKPIQGTGKIYMT